MRAYAIRRILLMIPTLLVASFIVFCMIRLVPGDVVEMMAAQTEAVTQMDVEALRHALGMDVPIFTQYGRWMGVLPGADGSISGIFQGDLGTSLWDQTNVSEQILTRVPVTLELALLALAISLLIAMPIGIYSALRQDTWGDYIARSFAIGCIAIPGFWLGTMIIVFPSIWWGYAPPMLLVQFFEDPIGNLQMFIIPSTILGMVTSGIIMRMTRTMVLEVLRQDYIRTAWAKGLKERRVILRHALKNALIPVVTVIGLWMPVAIGGTVIIEQIFNLPGMGRLFLDAIFLRDYPIVSGVAFVFGASMVFINLMVDLTYGFLDPRVHYK
ncbi:unnamed protein product [marine sediment metagenome]|uniref:ABC transmembrane type-1 domain-containing protein n=1 Tax=marine sediment metagenome TaxID=412755 RepID=X1FLG9_9ZZZZ